MIAEVGTKIYWTETIQSKRNEWPTRLRCGIVHAADDGGGVSVRMLKAIDPNTPPDEEGLALALSAGTWRFDP